eukprot:5602778-Prymnesium_polylepis.1
MDRQRADIEAEGEGYPRQQAARDLDLLAPKRVDETDVGDHVAHAEPSCDDEVEREGDIADDGGDVVHRDGKEDGHHDRVAPAISVW